MKREGEKDEKGGRRGEELQGIRVTANHPWVDVELNLEETQNLLGEMSDSVVYSEISLTNDSMRSQVMPPVAGGR